MGHGSGIRDQGSWKTDDGHGLFSTYLPMWQSGCRMGRAEVRTPLPLAHPGAHHLPHRQELMAGPLPWPTLWLWQHQCPLVMPSSLVMPT